MANEENRNVRERLAKTERGYGSAMTFATFFIFSSILVVKLILAWNSQNIAVENPKQHPLLEYTFLAHFWSEGFQGISVSWYLFLFIVVHAIRLQLGIAFDLYDKSYWNAVDGMPVNSAKRILRINAACRLWWMLCLGYLSFFLSNGTFWHVAINLLTQAAVLIIYDVNNWRRYKLDEDRRNNMLILVGDALFVLMSIWIVLHGETSIPLDGLKGDAVKINQSGWFVVLPLVLVSCFLLIEFFTVYLKGLWAALGSFARVAGAWPWWPRKSAPALPGHV